MLVPPGSQLVFSQIASGTATVQLGHVVRREYPARQRRQVVPVLAVERNAHDTADDLAPATILNLDVETEHALTQMLHCGLSGTSPKAHVRIWVTGRGRA